MIMDRGTIIREYNAAKNKKQQIGILADQNCCTREDIRKIIEEDQAKIGTCTDPDYPSFDDKEPDIMQIIMEEMDKADAEIKKYTEWYKKLASAWEVIGEIQRRKS